MRGGHRLTLSSTGALCRDAHLRSDDAWLRAARTRGAYLAVTTQAQVLVAGAQQPRLLTHADVGAGADGSTFLGHMHGTPLFAIAWGSLAPLTRTRLEEERDTKLVGLRTVLGTMDAGAINAAAMATGLAAWDAASRHCGVCGAATLVREAGHRKDCTDAACQTKHFPRTDAAVIMLVSDAAGEHCILGRQAAWEPGRYSTLAGFVEPGESLEDAVAREVLEEVGVVVRNVRYAGKGRRGGRTSACFVTLRSQPAVALPRVAHGCVSLRGRRGCCGAAQRGRA